MGASASALMRENLSPTIEKILKIQYTSLKKEGMDPDEIGTALMATLMELKQKEQEEKSKDDTSFKVEGEFKYYTDTLITYENGATYYGDLKQRRYLVIDKKTKKFADSKKHEHPKIREGYGVMKYDNGDIYRGDWLNNMCHGQGVMEYSNGNIYTGAWVKNMMTTGQDPKTRKPTDIGVMKIPNGKGGYDVYEGEFKCSMFEGQGVYRRADGTIDHDGIWYRDKPFHGPHKRIWINLGRIVKEVCDCEKKYDHIDTDMHPRKEDEDFLGKYEDIEVHVKEGKKNGPYLQYGDREIGIPRWADNLNKLTLEIAIKIIEGKEVAIPSSPKRPNHKRKKMELAERPRSVRSHVKASGVKSERDGTKSFEDGSLVSKSAVIDTFSEKNSKSKHENNADAESVADTKSSHAANNEIEIDPASIVDADINDAISTILSRL